MRCKALVWQFLRFGMGNYVIYDHHSLRGPRRGGTAKYNKLHFEVRPDLKNGHNPKTPQEATEDVLYNAEDVLQQCIATEDGASSLRRGMSAT